MRVANPKAKFGEDIASKFLQKKGYKIIDRNFRRGYGEIDIVAVSDDTLVFIEVKTRISGEFGTPLEAITSWKLKALIRTAQFYKLTHQKLPDSLRIDAVSVMLSDSTTVETIEHVENISGF